MIDITYTINGKTVHPQDSNAYEKALLEAVVAKAIEVVKSKLSPDEVGKIRINVVGESLDKLSLNIRGPEEIVDKLSDSL